MLYDGDRNADTGRISACGFHPHSCLKPVGTPSILRKKKPDAQLADASEVRNPRVSRLRLGGRYHPWSDHRQKCNNSGRRCATTQSHETPPIDCTAMCRMILQHDREDVHGTGLLLAFPIGRFTAGFAGWADVSLLA